jgi:hypothetical protein
MSLALRNRRKKTAIILLHPLRSSSSYELRFYTISSLDSARRAVLRGRHIVHIVQRRRILPRSPPESGPVVFLGQADIADTTETLSRGETGGMGSLGVVHPMHAAAVNIDV